MPLGAYTKYVSSCTPPPNLSQLGELGKGAGKGGGGGGSIREAGGAMGKKQAAEEEMYFKYVFVTLQQMNIEHLFTLHSWTPKLKVIVL